MRAKPLFFRRTVRSPIVPLRGAVALALSLACALSAFAQKSSNWRVYRLADGLPDASCFSITLAPHSKVLVRHLKTPFATELDGYGIRVLPLMGDQGASRVYQSPAGQMWTTWSQGLLEYKGGGWTPYRVPEIETFRSGDTTHSNQSFSILPVRQGVVLVLLPDALLECNVQNSDRPRTTLLRAAGSTKLKRFNSMLAARDGGLWVTGEGGVAKIPGPARITKPDTEWVESAAPGSLQLHEFRTPHEDEDGALTMLSEEVRGPTPAVVRFDGRSWTIETRALENVTAAWRGPDKVRWAITGGALVSWEEGRADTPELNEEITARFYYDAATEPNGAFWLATSSGLFRYAPAIWRTPKVAERISSPVYSLSCDDENRLWFFTSAGVYRLDDHQIEEVRLGPMPNRPFKGGRGILRVRGGGMISDTAGKLMVLNPPGGVPVSLLPEGSLARFKLLGLLQNGDACVQRLDSAENLPAGLIYVYDGKSLELLPDSPPGALLDGEFNTMLAAQNGDLWFAQEAGILWCHERKWHKFSAAELPVSEGPEAMCELADGRIWCAAVDRIWEFDGKVWSEVKRSLDRINDMVRTRDGSVWVASNNGLHRFFQGAWVENGTEEGLPSAAIRQLFEDQRGRLWAGTTHGLSLYFADADSDAPRTMIQDLPPTERNLPEGSGITITFTGQDKWKYTPRARLLYSYRLDEREWSPFYDANAVSFSDLAAGKHYFQVRAMDRNCNIDPKPARLEFAVVMPWYRESRLLLTTLIGLGAVLFFAALAFNRHRRLVRSYAEVEKIVAERTRELELANRELLQSQKMTALGTLAAGIAHDFNNILSIIGGSAQIIEDNLDNPEKVRTRADRIKTVVGQGAGIVKAMLGFSRDSGQEVSLLDINSVVSDTIKLLGDRFLREVQVAFNPQPNLKEITVCRDFVQQILLNFVFNAAEASSGHNKLIQVLTHQMTDLPHTLALLPGMSEAYVAVTVKDYGCGIPAENMSRIFEPFFTTKAFSARRGTGLGLSMVYELAKKMGAGLAVESALDKGSSFTLILPVSPHGGPATEATV